MGSQITYNDINKPTVSDCLGLKSLSNAITATIKLKLNSKPIATEITMVNEHKNMHNILLATYNLLGKYKATKEGNVAIKPDSDLFMK